MFPRKKEGVEFGAGAERLIFRYNSATGRGPHSFLKAEILVCGHVFPVAWESVYISIGLLLAPKMAQGVKPLQFGLKLLFCWQPSEPKPGKAHLLLLPIVLNVVTPYLIANGQKHSFLIRILELFIISPLFVYQ